MVSPDQITAPPAPNKSKPSASEIELRRLLKHAPQDLWLDTLRRTRGPQHGSLVYWMLNQTECDFAIAVHAFYRSKPLRHVENPKPLALRPGPADLFALVLLNWDTGSYRNHRLQVEPQDADPRTMARLRQKLMARPPGSLPFQIPQDFLTPLGGQPMKLAPHMLPDESPHLWALYANLGLKVDAAPPGLARRIAHAKTWLHRLTQTPRRA